MLSPQNAHTAVWQPLWLLPQRRDLVLALAKQGLVARYKGSILGLLWALVTPAVMIGVFTFIFAGIFGARFGTSTTKWDYALYLFCGLLPWTMFQESIQQSSTTIVTHANLVKRVVFPLETLPVAQVLSALANQLFGTVALLVAIVLIRHQIHPTILWFPLLLISQSLFAVGSGWLIASLGVFIRDMSQGIGLVLMVWMYLTPIIYPESIVPENLRWVIELNPFTALVRSYRRVLLDDVTPDWTGMVYFTCTALVVFFVGYWWFARTRKNFADVI